MCVRLSVSPARPHLDGQGDGALEDLRHACDDALELVRPLHERRTTAYQCLYIQLHLVTDYVHTKIHTYIHTYIHAVALIPPTYLPTLVIDEVDGTAKVEINEVQCGLILEQLGRASHDVLVPAC